MIIQVVILGTWIGVSVLRSLKSSKYFCSGTPKNERADGESLKNVFGNSRVDALRQGARRWSCGLGHVLPLTTRMSNDGNRQSSLTSAAIRSSSSIISIQTHSVCKICYGKDLDSCSSLFELDLRFYSWCLRPLMANGNTFISQCKEDF